MRLYVEEQMADAEVVSLSVGRRYGKGYRQIGEPFLADEIAGLGTSDSVIDAILNTKCRGRGAFELRAYRGKLLDGSLRTPQPLCRFETLADDTPERARGGSGQHHAIRDLSVQLRQNADMMATRLDSAMTRSSEQADKILELVMSFSRQERDSQDEAAGTVLNLSIQLVEARLRLQIAEQEIERVRQEAASSVVAAIVEKMPPEAIQSAVIGAVGLVGELGNVALSRLRGAPPPPPPPVVRVPVEPKPAAATGAPDNDDDDVKIETVRIGDNDDDDDDDDTTPPGSPLPSAPPDAPPQRPA